MCPLELLPNGQKLPPLEFLWGEFDSTGFFFSPWRRHARLAWLEIASWVAWYRKVAMICTAWLGSIRRRRLAAAGFAKKNVTKLQETEAL